MRFYFTFSIVFGFYLLGQSQDYQVISCGAGYNKQSYIKLFEGSQKQVANDAWDLAFTAFGYQDAGIFINESSGSSMGQNLPQTELYDAKVSDFNATIILDSIQANKYLNSEASWSYGAFNEARVAANPFDFGWGKYVPAAQRVEGDRVYVLKLRNGNYKKIKIESLIGTTYTFKYSNLDGTDVVTKTINKAPVNANKLVYFSFTTNDVVDIIPVGGYDLFYGRYISLARDPNGTVEQQYNVTGILSGPGVQVAAAKGIDPNTVSLQDYADKFSTKTDVIGYDWKTLVGTSWALAADQAFFVKTSDKRVWKIVIIDFEGSATGNAALIKTDLGISSNKELLDVETSISPNPADDQIFISLDTKDILAKDLNVDVIDHTGKYIYSNNMEGISGFNVLTINTSDWNKGLYLVKISNGKLSTTQKVIKL